MKFRLIGGGNLGVFLVKSPPRIFINPSSFRLKIRSNFLENIPWDMETYLCREGFPTLGALSGEISPL